MKKPFLLVMFLLSYCLNAETGQIANSSPWSKKNLRHRFSQRKTGQKELFTRFPFSRLDLSRQEALFRRLNQAKHQPATTGSFQLPEFLFDTTQVLGSAPGDQDFASVAFDGRNYFVVWQDLNRYQIVGARISPGGTLLDTFGILLCPDWYGQIYPAVAFDGSNYLVVWSDFRSGDLDIFGARVTPNGVVLDPEGFPISTAIDFQLAPAVIFDGTNYLVAWNDYRSGGYESDIYAARVTSDGEVLDPDGIAICTEPYNQTILHSIGFDRTNYLLAWHDDRDGDEYYDIYGARVSRNGTVIDPNGFVVSNASNNQMYPQVQFGGTDYLVVWFDDRNALDDYRIYGARVTPSGVVLDTQGIQIAQYPSVLPALSFDGTNYFVVWTDVRSGWELDIYGARVTPSGVVLDTSGIPISTAEFDQYLPAIVFDGARYFTVWSDYRDENTDIYGARVTPSGTVLDPDGILLDYGYTSATQYASKAAFDGANFLVVWEDYRNDEGDIYGVRVTPNGVVLDPAGIPIATTPGEQYSPAVAFDGTNYLVVWGDYRNWQDDIYGARVTPSGVVLDPDGIQITSSEMDEVSPAIAYDGRNYLVVWNFVDWENEKFDIYGARVTPEGNVLDHLSICSYEGWQTNPAVVKGTTYLVVWADDRDGDWNIYGARVTPNGEVLDPNGIPISTAEFDQNNPAVGYCPTGYLVVWADDRDGDWYYDIYGARVNNNGVVVDTQGISVSIADGDQFGPALTFDGSKYLVVWTDSRNGDYDIYGARVTPTGDVLDREGMELINQSTDRYVPSITTHSFNYFLLTFTGYVESYQTTKILGAFYPEVGITETASPQRRATGLKISSTVIKNTGTVEFNLNREEPVRIELVDISGRVTRVITAGNYPAGVHQVRFEAQNLQAGVYFLRFTAGDKSMVRRVAIVK